MFSPGIDGAYFSGDRKEALWDKFFTGAPQRCPQHLGWPLLAGMPPILRVSLCNKVLSMSCHSSPQKRVGDVRQLDNFPFALPSLQRSHRYYGQLRPSSRHRYSSSWCLPFVISLANQNEVLTFHTKPVLSSCRLYTDCHRDLKQVSSRLILESMVVSSSGNTLRQ